jgi:hypothetical protein
MSWRTYTAADAAGIVAVSMDGRPVMAIEVSRGISSSWKADPPAGLAAILVNDFVPVITASWVRYQFLGPMGAVSRGWG